MKKKVIKNNFRILKKKYAYLQTIPKAPVKFEKDWPKTVGGVAGRRMVGALTDGRTYGRTDPQNFRGYNIIPRHFFWWRGIKNEHICYISRYFLHYFVSPFHRYLANAISTDYARSRAGQYTSCDVSNFVALIQAY